MEGIKNKYEFYKGFLEALGAEDVAETEYRNEEQLRRKILDTLGVDYVLDDVNQTDLFRGKFLEGLANGGGGGSSDFSTAEVTITSDDEYVDGLMINYITENGVELTNSPDVGTYETVLYNGMGNAYKVENLHKTITVTGNAEYNALFGIITITGDCAIDVRV